jgi:hypothetical protein
MRTILPVSSTMLLIQIALAFGGVPARGPINLVASNWTEWRHHAA